MFQLRTFSTLIGGLLAASAAVSVHAQSASMPMAASGGMSSIGMTDKNFVVNAAVGGMTEVELGKLATTKGSSQAVKDYGAKMVDDHTKAGDELKATASPKGITAPDKLDAMHQQLVDKFSKMSSGPKFDKAYHDQMVTDHKKTIALFMTESKSGKDADLKAFATKTLPSLQDHLKMLQMKM